MTWVAIEIFCSTDESTAAAASVMFQPGWSSKGPPGSAGNWLRHRLFGPQSVETSKLTSAQMMLVSVNKDKNLTLVRSEWMRSAMA